MDPIGMIIFVIIAILLISAIIIPQIQRASGNSGTGTNAN